MSNYLRLAEIYMAPHLYAAEFRMTPNLGDVVNVEHPDVLGAVAIGPMGWKNQRDMIVRAQETRGRAIKPVWC
jgi:hypothetical protein